MTHTPDLNVDHADTGPSAEATDATLVVALLHLLAKIEQYVQRFGRDSQAT